MEEMTDSIAENQAQLSMIEMALKGDPGNPELIQLKSDLEALIQLTKDSLQEDSQQVGKKEDSIYDVDDDDDDDDDVQVLQTGSSKSLEDDLSSLEGVKVSAPFSTSYSGVSYHNAVIFTVESQDFQTFQDIEVRVVFSHPTQTGMVPCKHFLEDRCNREDRDCRWSHGEKVNLASLREWVEPDFSDLGPGGVVLVPQDDGVWKRATIQGREEQSLILKFEGSKSDPFSQNLETVFPLNSEDGVNFGEEDEDDKSTNALVHDTIDSIENETFAPVVLSIEGRLGDWENYTRGVGSALMSKMGWTGGGLGKEGEGRVEPVPARLYPQGKSLDWCMERREEAGGGDILNVEKILKKEAKDAQRTSAQRARRERERDNSAKSLFDFINVKLGGRKGNISDLVGTGSKSTKDGVEKKKKTLQTASNENLKIENFKLGEKIRIAEKEIFRLKESWKRHKEKDTRTAETFKTRIDEKELELARLRSSERKLVTEQGNRKSTSKLSIF